MDAEQADGLLRLGRWLEGQGYRFVTVTPESHRRVTLRGPSKAETLRDIFGWNRPFDAKSLPSEVRAWLAAAGALHECSEGWRSGVRYSSLSGRLFVHSAYPTTAADAVFFGPDTYRFCRALSSTDTRRGRLVDVACGSGAGGIVAASPGQSLVLADINPKALAYARVNCALAGLANVSFVQSDILQGVEGNMGCIISNPPYLRDDAGRTYRDGGGDFGEGLAVRIVREALGRLDRGGKLCVYTGSAIVDGEDTFLRAVAPVLLSAGVTSHCDEIDPDVFGEELEHPAYARADRIAAVWLTATLPA